MGEVVRYSCSTCARRSWWEFLLVIWTVFCPSYGQFKSCKISEIINSLLLLLLNQNNIKWQLLALVWKRLEEYENNLLMLIFCLCSLSTFSLCRKQNQKIGVLPLLKLLFCKDKKTGCARTVVNIVPTTSVHVVDPFDWNVVSSFKLFISGIVCQTMLE